MTTAKELADILTKSRNKMKKEEEDLEVSGLGSSDNPLLSTPDRITEDGELDQTDPDLIDQLLYMNPRNRPSRGEGASSWDSDY